MWKRIIWALLVGSICGAIAGAVGFSMSERVFGRDIGIIGNSPALAALSGAVYLGASGAVTGAIVAIANLNVLRSGIVGLICGVLLVTGETWGRERRYFYEGGYFGWQMFYSDITRWITFVLGLALAAMAVSILQRRRFGKGK